MNKIISNTLLFILLFRALNSWAQTGGSVIWSPVGALEPGYQVQNIKSIGNDLYASLSYAIDSARIAKWNGLFWTYTTGLKVLPFKEGLSYDIYNDTLYVTYNENATGKFLRVKKLINAVWVNVPVNSVFLTDTLGTIKTASIKTVNNSLYLFGNLVDLTNKKIGVIKYGSGTWTAVGPAVNPGIKGGIGGLSSYQNKLMIHGYFSAPFYYNLLTSNSDSTQGSNLLWNGTNWQKFNNLIDSAGVLYNDNDSLFLQKDSLLYKYYNSTFTNISSNLSIPGVCSTFVAIKGKYYLFGDFKLNGNTVSYYSLAVKNFNSWFLLEKNLSREGIINHKDHLHSPAFNPQGKVEMLNANMSFIKGNIYKDNNGNCVRDAGDDTLKLSRKITVMPDSVVTTTDSYGNYFATVTPGNKTVSNSLILSNKYLHPSACSGNSKSVTTLSDSLTTVDFPMTDSTGISDVAVKVIPNGGSKIRKQQNDLVSVNIINVGTMEVASGTVKLKLSNLLSLVSSSPSYTSFTGGIVTWNFANLKAEEIRSFSLQVHVSSSAATGDSITYAASVTPSADADNSDNEDSTKCCIVASYDPNEKLCYPEDIILSNTDKLRYSIHFQNTGTSYAQNVYVVDTLDTNLPMDKIEITGWSTVNRPRVEVRSNRVLVFTFANILLPDSNSNEKASHGYINYSCGLYKNLPLGTKITNRADIYFDYNAAVPTNKTENIRTDKLGFGKNDSYNIQESLKIFPNPANDELTVALASSTINTITVCDLSGREILKKTAIGLPEIKFNTSGLPEGVYFIRVEGPEEIVMRKIVVCH